MRYGKAWLSLVAVFTMPLNNLWAQEQAQTTADDRQALIQEIEDLKKRLDALDQRVKADDRNREIKTENDAAAAKTAA